MVSGTLCPAVHILGSQKCMAGQRVSVTITGSGLSFSSFFFLSLMIGLLSGLLRQRRGPEATEGLTMQHFSDCFMAFGEGKSGTFTFSFLAFFP